MATKIRGNFRESYAFMFLAILGWGISAPFIEYGLIYISPLPFLTYRFLLVVLILTPHILVNRMEQFKEIITNKWVWIIGVSEAMGLTLQYLGQEKGVPSSIATLLAMMFIIIVPFFSRIVLKESIQFYHAIAIIVAISGVFLITTEGNINTISIHSFSIIGTILLVISAFAYALYLVSTSRLTTIEKPDIDIFTLFYSTLLIITFFSGFATAVFGNFQIISSEVWIWLILLGLFSTMIAFFSYFKALKTIPVNTASVLLPLQALIPFAIEFLIFGKNYSLSIILGSVLIVLSIIIVVVIPIFHRPLEKGSKNKSVVECNVQRF